MLHSFYDEGIVSLEGGAWRFKEVSQYVIPTTIKDLITLRIERLDEGAIDAIKHASVIGREFEFNVLGRTMEMNEEELISTLENLETKKIITVDSENDELYRFNHSKIREVVYEELGGHRKRILHEKVAVAMEELNMDNIENVVYKLAHHYSNTKDHKKTLEYSMKAGEKASSDFALNEAFEYYQLGLNALESMEDNKANKRRKLEITTHLGDICYVIGEWDSALEYYNIVRELSEDLEDEKGKAESFRSIGLIFYNKNEWEKALGNLEVALKISDEIKDYHRIADLYYYLGTIYERKGEYQKAFKTYGKCMENAVNIGDSPEIARAYMGVGRIHAQKGKYQDSIETFKKALNILEKKGDLEELTRVYAHLGATYNFVDGDKAIKYHEKAIGLANKTGNIRMKGYAIMNIAHCLIIQNSDLEKAVNHLEQALEIFRKFDEKIAISSTYISYGTIYKLQKEWEKSKEYFEGALNICKEVGTPYYLADVLFEYGLMYKEKGDFKEANQKLSNSLEIYENLQNKMMVEKIKKEMVDL
jgi:tetratricopeptide (TPR) repeat protein